MTARWSVLPVRSPNDLRYGGGDDQQIGAAVGAAYRREGERAERLAAARERGERLGAVLGRLAARAIVAAAVLVGAVGAFAVGRQVWRLAEWLWR